MKIKKIVFAQIVKGDGAPGDMLRYDGAFLCNTKDMHQNIVAFPMWKTKDGDLNGVITDGRWRSFGVKLQAVSNFTADELRQEMMTNASQWITFRKVNESGLVPFTFREYLLVKDSRKLQDETRIRTGKEKCSKCGSPEGQHMERCPEKI